MIRLRPDSRVTVAAVVLYTVLALAATWPLAAGLARDVPGDFGDPLLNLWILDWVARGLAGVASGATTLEAVANANIFHPEPVVLGFSEHLAAQALMAAPVLAATSNVLLAYNLVFVAAYALSGIGMFLLVRELTRSTPAALVAGVVFGFAPLRAAQLSHIQVLSTQWLPFAMLGWQRYVASGRGWPLAGATAATLMLGWSSGYALLFATPLLAMFVLHQVWSLRRLRDARLWAGVAVATLVLVAGLWPVATLYLRVREVHALERPRSEVVSFSADLGGYLTAPDTIRLWGSRLRVAPRPEGEVFLGFTAMALAIIGVAVAVARPDPRDGAAPLPRRVAAGAGAVLCLMHLSALAIVIVAGPLRLSLLGLTIRATDPGRLLALAAAFAAAWLWLSPLARRSASRFVRSWQACAALAVVLTVWLSLGPSPTSGGRALTGLGLYGVLLDHVPGYSGLRVPARFAFVASAFVALLAGAGTRAICRWVRFPVVLACGLGALAFAEGWAAPIALNAFWSDSSTAPPPRVYAAVAAPAVYRALGELTGPVVIAEFPFGDAAWELRYVFYATVHRHRLVNGYSGGFPAGYQFRVARFQRISEEPAEAWQALRATGTTHVVVHRRGMGQTAVALQEWLVARGARLVAIYDGEDELYQLGPPVGGASFDLAQDR